MTRRDHVVRLGFLLGVLAAAWLWSAAGTVFDWTKLGELTDD